MHELTDQELYRALQFAKNQDEHAGRKILDTFQTDQPAMAKTIFGVLPSMIAERDQAMAHLFMDVCFDVICVFQHAFGTLPSQQVLGFEWLAKSAAQLDPELQAMMSGESMNKKWRDKLQNRFKERMIDSQTQSGLIDFLNATIDQFVAEQQIPPSAVEMTKAMTFVVIQLFNSMYTQAKTA